MIRDDSRGKRIRPTSSPSRAFPVDRREGRVEFVGVLASEQRPHLQVRSPVQPRPCTSSRPQRCSSGLVGLTEHGLITQALGTISCSSSSRFARESVVGVRPVTLPPGRDKARDETAATGSDRPRIRSAPSWSPAFAAER